MINIKSSFSRFGLISAISLVLITLPLAGHSAKPDKSPGHGKGGIKKNDKNISQNTAAVITGIDSGSITEDLDPDADDLLEVGGKLDISDADAGEAAFNQVTSYGKYDLVPQGHRQ